MNTDLLKSILSIIAAAIPPLISLIFFLIQRSERISIPLDSPAIKVLKIQRFSVDEKYFKHLQRNFNIINIVIVFIALIIYIFLLSINEGSQNFYKQIIIFFTIYNTCVFLFYYI